tara:strand:- start:22 stop:348 length:327 start_codon:yes stop_codon:yes gene_type:complete
MSELNVLDKRDMVKCIHWRDCNVNNGGCCAINKYSHPSIAVCLQMCDENTEKPKGLGDTIARTIEKVTRGKLKPKKDGDCGCNKRRKQLNKLLPYKNKQKQKDERMGN